MSEETERTKRIARTIGVANRTMDVITTHAMNTNEIINSSRDPMTMLACLYASTAQLIDRLENVKVEMKNIQKEMGAEVC